MISRLKTILLFLLLCTNCLAIFAQNSWQHYFDLLVENSEEDENNEDDLQTIYDALSDVAENPLNINAITEEQLQDMMCFSDVQIQNITQYVNRYGPIRTKGEYMLIPYLDDISRGLLSSLTYIGEYAEKERTFLDTLRLDSAIREYHHSFPTSVKRADVTASVQIPFYTRQGDIDGYAGYNIKHWLRGIYKIERNISVGFVASQDAGEPFFGSSSRYGYDYYSGYINIKKKGAIKNLVIGRYRIRSGLGLILNNNFSFGKLFSIQPLTSSSTTILPHASRSEGNYMQGGAATIELHRNLQTTFFASYRTIDGTLTDDDSAIKTIVKTGYHRTESEIARRHNAFQTTFGAVIRYKIRKLNIGINGLANHYSLPLQPYTKGSSSSQLYRKFAPNGQDFWNVSIDYTYKLGKRFNFAGETSTGDCKKIATINTLTYSLSSKLQLMGIQRFYPVKYYSTMGRSFSEGGSNQDESGMYIGAQWSPSTRLSINAYTDIAYFAWPKYQASASSHSFDNLLQLNYSLTPNSSLNLRYRLKMREKDVTDDDGDATSLLYKNEHRLRLSYYYHSGQWAYKTQADVSYCKFSEESLGGMISECVTYSMKPLKIAAGVAYFHTKDYNSRVYVYEQSTPYNLSFPSFFGHGCRAYILLQANIIKNISLIGKVGYTHYFDRDEIGSGLQMVKSNHLADLNVMLRWTI